MSLGATPSGGATINWFTAASGGAPIATGNSYTTPSISTTTSYYVSASQGGTTSNVSKLTVEPASTGTVLTTYTQDFTVTTGFTLNSLQVFSTTGTSITISLFNAGGVSQLLTTGAIAVTAGDSPIIPIGWSITPGTYRLSANGMTGNFIRDNTVVTYPFALGTVGTMNGFTSAITGAVTTSSSYYFLYNWNITTGCESARSLVTATVTSPPAINLTINPGTTVCKGTSITLSAASPTNDPNYTYSWGFNSTSTVATGASFGFTGNQDSTVYFTAEDLNGASPNFGCRYVQNTFFTVKDSAVTPIVSPASASTCTPGTCQTFTVTNATTSVPVVADIGTSTTTLSTTANPLRAGAGALWEIRTQLLVTAAELSAAGLTAGNLTSLAFVTNSVGGVMDNFSISIGNTVISAFTTTFEVTSMTTVYSFPGTFTPTVGVNTYTFSSPFPWNGTSNIVINVCGRNSTTGTTVVQASTPGFAGDLYAASLTGCTAATGATSTTRPIMKIGGFMGVPATYVWNPGALTGSSVNVCPSTTTVYTVTVTNGVGCTKSKTVTYNVTDVAYAGSTTSNVTCNGGSNGSITVTATGTYTPFQYSINGGTTYQLSNVFTGLTAGSYNVRVKGSLNCPTAIQVVTLTQPSAVTFTGTPTNATCYGGNDGSITLGNEAGGNGGPFTYSIDNGTSYQSSASFTGLIAGTYQARIKDVTGCASAAVAVAVGTTPATQYTITATASAGGTISPAGATNVDCGLNQSYTITANTCYQLDSVYVDGANIGAPTSYTFSSVKAAHTINAYFSLKTYTITATAGTGGTISSPGVTTLNCGDNITYTMTPNGGFIVDSIGVDGLNAGSASTYTFTNVMANHTIDVKFSSCTNPVVVNAGANAAVCAGQTYTLSGSIGGSASSATWTTSGSGSFSPNTSTLNATYTPSAGDNTSGSVILTLTTNDPVGPCPSDYAYMTLTINALPVINISGQVQICPSGSTTLTANASGTITGYQWDLNGTTTLGTTQSQVASAIGTYNVLVTNNHGCTNTASATTVAVDAPVISISGTSPICFGTSTTLTAVTTLTSGTVTGYLWSLNGTSTGVTTSTTTVSQAGSYTVVATSSYGCVGTSSAFVLSYATGPLSGIYTINSSIAASCTNFISFKNALTALNTYGVAGNVTFDVSAGHTETAPTGGLQVNMCGLSPSLQSGATQTITFQKSGAGANPVITAQVGTGAFDGIFELVGADYVTIDGINLSANPANVTSTTQAEWGYALLKCSGADGANNNTIKNCTVTLNKTNTASIGIYSANHTPTSNTQLTVSTLAGTNSNNVFVSNAISNSYYGIYVNGFTDVTPYTYFDQNNQIGQTGLGNTITNIGGGANTCLGIYTDRQNGQKVISNTINSTGTGSQTGTMYGIWTADGSRANTDIIGNTITLVHGAAATGQQIAIINTSGSRLGRPTSTGINNIINIKNNIIQNCVYPSTGTTTSLGAYIYSAKSGADSLSAYNVIITGNQITNNTYSSSGASTIYGIISQSVIDSTSISNNTISNNTMASTNVANTYRVIVTGYGGHATNTIPYVYNLNVSGNTISNNVTATTTGTVDNIAIETYTGASPNAGSKVTVRDNTIGNTTITAISTVPYNGITASPSVNTILDVSKNTITNITRNNATTGNFVGITLTGTSMISTKLDSNVVSNISHTGATTSTFTGINHGGSTTLTTNYSAVRNTLSGNVHTGTGTMGLLVNGNAVSYTITNNSILINTKTSATTGVLNCLTVTGSTTASTVNVSSNTITGNTATTTSIVSLLEAGSGVSYTINNNMVSGNIDNGASGTMYCTKATGASTTVLTYNNNQIFNNSFPNTSGATASFLYGYYNFGSVGVSETYTGNQFYNLTMGGTNTATTSRLVGLYSGTSGTSVKTVSNNLIYAINSNVTGTGAVLTYGMVMDYGAAASQIYKNKIYNISNSGSGTTAGVANGLGIGAFTTTSSLGGTYYNNYIGDITAPNSTSTDAVRGISILSASTTAQFNIYFNTIRLSATSAGANFGSSGIFHTISATATTAALDLRNNIIINSSTAVGTGATVAYRRSTTGLLNYVSTSDRNILYAGTLGTANLIYGEGTGTPTNPQQTIANFRTFVGPTREVSSQTENVQFTSLTGSNAQYLHVNPAIATLVEGGASVVSSPFAINDDYDGDLRSATPDIGADEGNFIAAALVINSITATPGSACAVTSHLITAVITPGSTAVASATLNYTLNGVAQTGIVMTNISGNTWTATILATAPNVAVATSVTASDAAFTIVKVGPSYKDQYLGAYSMLTTATPNPVCANSTTTLNAVVGGPGTAVVGAGATTSATYSNPFYSLYSNTHVQHLILASELQVAGLTAGNLTSLALSITVAGTLPMLEFSLSVGQTNATTMSSYITSGLTTVYTSASFLPVVGLNTMTFSSPIPWNGTSNIVVEICHGNSASTATMSRTCEFDVTAYISTIHTHKTASTGGNAQCTDLTTNLLTYSGRPKMTFNGIVGPPGFTYNWTASPAGNGLNSATGASVTATPTTAGVYNYAVVGTDANGCTVAGSVNVTVNAQPATPTATNSTQCGSGVPTCSVSGNGGIYSWFLTPTGGVAISGETNTTLATYSVSSTTTFYVSENNGTCISQRVPVTVTVNQPDLVTLSATPSTVCLGHSFVLNGTQQGSTSVYTLSWTSSPSSGSGITGSVSGNGITVLPTAAGTYTYTLTASDPAASCTYINTINVIVKALPVITTATASPSSVCAGSNVTLTALTGSTSTANATIGTGTTSIITGSDGNPLRSGNGVGNQIRSHMIILASTLSAQGFVAGPISSLAFVNSPTASTGTIVNFEIKMGHTAVSAFTTTTFETTPLISVYTNPSITFSGTVLPTFTFSTPFVWNGISNLLINTCQTNSVTGTTNILAVTPGFNAHLYKATATTSCADLTASVSMATRPVMILNGTTSTSGPGTYTWTWNPGAINGNSVSVIPASTGSYTVTASDPATGCTATASVPVTVNPIPATPVATNGSHCGTGVPVCSVTSGGGIMRWYLASSGGIPISGESGSVLTSYTINTTTTFYVAEWDGSCEGLRTAVTETVIVPDAITASSNVNSICPGGSVNLSATQTGSTYTYTYAWTASPSTGSGISGSMPGQNVTVMPTAAGSYTYTATATSTGGGCVTTSTKVITVTASPSISSATASPSTICSGSNVTLTALTGSSSNSQISIGTGTSTSTAVGINPLSPFWETNRVQYLIPATELTALNLVAGNISALSFNITAFTGLTFDWQGYTVKMAHTAVSALTTTFQTPAFSTVFGPTTIAASAVAVGYNGIPLTTPFNWNGTSNILVDICFSNDPTGTCTACYNPSASLTFAYTATTYNSVTHQVNDNQTNCGTAVTGTISTFRPNFRLVGQTAIPSAGTYNWVWNPGAISGNTTVVTPATTTTYTVTATDPATSCTSTASVLVTVNVTPTNPVATNSTQCGYGTPTCSVTGSGGIFRWYLASTGGAAISGQSGPALSSYPISATTTFYVSEWSGLCEGPRTAVTATVTPSDAINITGAPASICLGASFSLNGTKVAGPNTYTYAWTASPSTGSGISGSVSGTPVTITPTAAGTYVYTVVGTDAGNNCANFSTVSITVNALPATINAGPDQTICSGSNVTLSASSGAFIPTLRMTELMIQGWIASGYSGYTPPYVIVPTGTTLDFYEITNLGTSPVDPSGVTFETWSSVSTTAPELTRTIPVGAAMVPSGGSIFFQANTPFTDDLANNVYTFNVSKDYGSGTAVGYILRKNGVIFDAVATSGYVFPVASGVTASDWSGVIASTSGQNGSVLISNDNNTNTCWSVTNTAGPKSSYGTVNPGVTVNLVPSGAVTWTSIPPGFTATTASATFGPVNANTQFVVHLSNGICESTDTVDVTVLTSSPTPIITSSIDSICGSNSATFTITNAVSGEITQWQRSSTGNIGTWSNISGANGLTLTLTPTSTFYYRVYASCTGSADTSNVKLVVVSNPTILGTTGGSRCGAGSVTLTASGTGTLEWFDAAVGGSLVGTGSTYTAYFANTSTYYVQARVGTCVYPGGRQPATAVINASPTAAINVVPDQAVCAGTVLNFTASSSNTNYTYSWSTNGVNILGTGTSFTHTPSVNTVYYLQATDNNGASPYFGCGYQATKVMTVNPNPTTPVLSSSNPTICSTGGSSTLTITNPDNSGGTAYLWSPGGATTTSITVSPTSTTTYSVTATNQNIVGVNVAPSAVALSSGGGAAPDYGAQLLNDGLIPACDIAGIGQWGWVTSNGS